MKITFKLNNTQAIRAAILVAEQEEAMKQSLVDVEISGSSWKLEECGNLQSVYISGHVNTNQYLQFNSVNNTLTYVGERCPFGQDGALKTTMKILTGSNDSRNYMDYIPHKYETSDIRLNWYEDLHSYMRNRASLMEKASYKLKCYKEEGYSPYLSQLERDLGIKLNLTVKALYASYDAKLANVLAALIGIAHQH